MAVLGFEVQTWKEGLLLSHVVAWIAAAYCYWLVMKLPLGISRFISCIPVFALYASLPLIYNRSTHLVGVSFLYAILTWLGSCKLLLLCWGQGPGYVPWVRASFPRFAIVMTYPAHVKRTGKGIQSEYYSSWWEQVSKSEVWYMLVFRSVVKLTAMAVLLQWLSWRDYALPGIALHLLLSLQVYLFASTVLEVLAAVANLLFGVTVEAHFDNPFAAVSLGEFWGHRWNLLVSNYLREMVYNPVLSILGRSSTQEIRVSDSSAKKAGDLGTRQHGISKFSVQEKDVRRRFDWAKLVAMLAAFLVSGLLHELMVYYVTLEVTWEMTSFFVVQGVAVGLEEAWKLHYPKSRPPRVVRTLLTLGFVFVSAHWLFWPPLDGINEQMSMETRKMLLS